MAQLAESPFFPFVVVVLVLPGETKIKSRKSQARLSVKRAERLSRVIELSAHLTTTSSLALAHFQRVRPEEMEPFK